MSQQSPWTESGWWNTVQEWIHRSLEPQGIVITGSLDQIHTRPWSTIVSIPTDAGLLFFKASAAFAAHEVGVTAYLSRLQPDFMPRLIAVEKEHAWMIMRDGGLRLAEMLQQQLDWRHWHAVLPCYGGLQREVAHHTNELLALGIPDRRLAHLPSLYRKLLAEIDLFQIDLPPGISTAQFQRLQALTDVFTQKCERLAGYAIPETIHHGDLHDRNIFYTNFQYAFYDWGDCSLSHPFFSYRKAYMSASARFRLNEGSPEGLYLRDLYLSVWHEFETNDHLIEVFGLAEEIWAISSLLIWHEVIKSLDEEGRKQYAPVIPRLGQELLGHIKD